MHLHGIGSCNNLCLKEGCDFSSFPLDLQLAALLCSTVLSWAELELIFFIVAVIGLCFGFVLCIYADLSGEGSMVTYARFLPAAAGQVISDLAAGTE